MTREEDAPGAQLQRVRFVGGELDGVVLDLPAELADAQPGRLTVTAGGRVFDRARRRAVTGARIIEGSKSGRARTARPRPGTV